MAKRKRLSDATKLRRLRADYKMLAAQYSATLAALVYQKEARNTLAYFGRKLARAANENEMLGHNYDMQQILAFLRTILTEGEKHD